MIELHATAEGVLFFRAPIETIAGIPAECFEALVFDGIAIRGATNRQSTKAATALAGAESCIVRPPNATGEKRIGIGFDLVSERCRIPLNSHVVVKPSSTEITGIEIGTRESTRFAVGFFIGIERENQVAAVVERVEQFDRAGIEIVVAVRTAEAICFVVVEVGVVAEFPHGAIGGGES